MIPTAVDIAGAFGGAVAVSELIVLIVTNITFIFVLIPFKKIIELSINSNNT